MPRRTHNAARSYRGGGKKWPPALRGRASSSFDGDGILADRRRERAAELAVTVAAGPARTEEGRTPAPASPTSSHRWVTLVTSKRETPRSDKRGASAIDPIRTRKDGNNSVKRTS
jgi:hypothetical protein